MRDAPPRPFAPHHRPPKRAGGARRHQYSDLTLGAGVPGFAVTEPARRFAAMMLGTRMPPAMRPFWALHVAGAVALLPEEVRHGYGLPRWPVPRLAIGAAVGAINYGYLLFAPVRRARARMRRVEREMRAQGWSR